MNPTGTSYSLNPIYPKFILNYYVFTVYVFRELEEATCLPLTQSLERQKRTFQAVVYISTLRLYSLSCLFQRTGRGHLFAFDPITGAPEEDIPSGGLHLDFEIVQSFMFGEMDEEFLRGIVMVDESLKVSLF